MQYPGLFISVDSAAGEQQKRFFTFKAVELLALGLGALAGTFGVQTLSGVPGIFAVLCFVAAVAIRLSRAGETAEKRWYDARAAAESIKSLSWQYAVAGEAFRAGDPDPEGAFTSQLRQILRAAVPHLDVPAPRSADVGAVTDVMRSLRTASRDERCRHYQLARIDDQVDWYARKAKWNKRRSRAWSYAVVVIELSAVAAGIARVNGMIDVDLLGVFGAASAGLLAWVQAKNYTQLSESYAVTSHEVALVSGAVRADVSEQIWAQSVHDAEAAFSREHTLWLARRQSLQAN
ncbi:DUF4231 domain-containing protein [Jannaschia sp. R86511]|uniref:DUF4231 domain-containing protein n=1 Tax=Jannaschia sp. R86511 TaxID=3093853 RepID=UPI0036D3C79F